jgi:hypothetical protein
LAGLSGGNASQDETVPLWPFLVLDDSPQLGIPKTPALAGVWINTGEDPEAVVAFVVLAQGKFPQSDAHDIFAGVAVGDLDNLGDTAGGDDTDNVLVLG